MTAAAWQSARRILCVRLDNLGDVLMTTPALRALATPGRELTLLTSPLAAPAVRCLPEVRDAIIYDAPWHRPRAAGAPADESRLIEALARRHFDAAVIFTVYSQSPLPSALVCRMASIPLRLAHCRENPYALLTDWVRETEPQLQVRHEVQRQLDLVARVGAITGDTRLSWRLTGRDRAAAAGCLRAAGVEPEAPWVLLHPGASAESRRYPVEQFAAAADRIQDELGCPIVIGGGAGEGPLVARLRSLMRRPAVALAGVLDIPQYAAAIAMARVVVCNNTGPAHIAAATGTPVVDLYALTNLQHTPWQVPHRVLFHDVPCRNCYRSVCPQGHHHCLRKVSPQAVAEAAVQLFRASPREQSAAAPIPRRVFTRAAATTEARPA